MKTPNVQAIVDKVLDRYPETRVGAWLCRRIEGTLTWSQHSWTENPETGTIYAGNAADIFGPTSVLDQVAPFIRTQPNVKVVLWRVKNHFDHVHFDTWPTGIVTPPCRGGTLHVKHKDGTIGRTFQTQTVPPVPTPPIGDHDMTAAEFVSRLSPDQVTAICNRAGQGGVWVINPTSADRVGVTNYYLSILNTPTNPDWAPFFQEVQAEALVNAAINP